MYLYRRCREIENGGYVEGKEEAFNNESFVPERAVS